MLGKLIKHEFKAVSKFLSLIMVFMIILTIVGSVGIYITDFGSGIFTGLLVGLFTMAYIAGVFLLSAGTFIYLWMRFHNSMYGREGYLTNTLPTTSAKLIYSKMVVAITWAIINITILITSILTIAIASAYAGKGYFTNEFPTLFADLREYGISIPGMIILYVLLIFASIVMSVLMMYGSSALGQLAKKNRVFITICYFFGMTMIINVVGTIMAAVAAWIIYEKNKWPSNVIFFESNNHEDYVQQLGFIFRSMNWIAFACLILVIAGSVALYFATNYVTSKKLNLE